MLQGILTRLKYVGVILVVLVLAVVAGVQAVVMTLYVLGYFGQKAGAHILLNAAYFSGGALLVGGALALLNAVVSPKPFWFKSVFAAAIAGGIVSVAVPGARERVTDHVLIIFGAVTNAIRIDPFAERDAAQAAEDVAAIAFVRTQKAVSAAAGENFEAQVIGRQPDKEGRTVVGYEIAVKGRATVYAIVDVKRTQQRVDFSLLCLAREKTWSGPIWDSCK